MLTIMFGLTAALMWGAADFAGGLASRKTPAYQVVAATWFLGLLLIPLVALLSGEPVIPLRDWLWCGAAGGFGVLGIMLLYQTMAEGMMSISAAVSAVTAAALPVLAGSLISGFPGVLTIIGFIFALAAVWFISSGDQKQIGFRFKEIRLPLLAGIGFGLYFIFFNRGSQTSVFWPMVASRLMGALVLSFFLIGTKRSWQPAKQAYLLIGVNFVLDTVGTIAFAAAGQAGRMDIASVLSALYPGMTIVLAWWLLKEKIYKMQWVGIGLAIIAIFLFSI